MLLVNTAQGPTELTSKPLDLPILRIGHDLNVFGLINESSEPLAFERILESTKADSDLLDRVLRYLTKLDVINEHKGYFSPSRLSRAMTSEKADAMRPLLYVCFLSLAVAV